jgi:hypothetical protein
LDKAGCWPDKSSVVVNREKDSRLLPVSGDNLRAVLPRQLNQFAEFVFRFLKLPASFKHVLPRFLLNLSILSRFNFIVFGLPPSSCFQPCFSSLNAV